MDGEPRLRGRLVLAVLLIVGALVRVGYLVERQGAPDFRRPVIDAGFHDDWARCMAFGAERAGEWRPAHVSDPGLETEPYLRPPAYPMLLSVVYRISGGSPTAAVLAQMLLGMVSIALAWAIARRFGPTSAAIAGGVMAIHWALVYYEGELLAPPLVIALQLAMILVLMRATDRGSPGAALGAGVLLGLAVLTRPNVLAQLAAVVPWLVVVARRAGRPAWRDAALFAVGAAVAIAPATIRNLRVSGEFVPVTSALGVNLWIGNHDGADGLITSDLAGMGTFRTCYDWPDVVENVERSTGREMSTSAASGWFQGLAVDWITSEPGAFVALTARKAALFWGPAEIANNKDVAAEKRNSRVLRWLPLPFPLLALGAFAGLGLYFATRRRRDEPGDSERSNDELVALVAGLALITFLSLLPFFAAARFRVPMVPFLALLAGLLPAFRVASTSGRAVALGVSGALVAAAWLGAPDVGGNDERYHLDRGRALYNQVTDDTPQAQRDALYAQAREELERALDVGGGGPSAQFEMGVLEQRIGDLAAARDRYLACLERDPARAPAHYNLAFAYEGLGDPEAAIASFHEAARFDPASGRAPFEEARLLQSLGRVAPAIAALREANARDPENVRTRQILARSLASVPDPALRDSAEAVRLAESLPREGADAVVFDETRARAFAAAGRKAEALAAIDAAIARARSDGAPQRLQQQLGRSRTAIEAGRPPWGW